MKKSILIEKTSKYILITSYLIGRLAIRDPHQEISYLDLNISLAELGLNIMNKLYKSKEISEEVFLNYFGSSEIKESYKNELNKIKSNYKYKNNSEIYKDTLFLNVDIRNDKFIISPLHQDSLGGYTSARDKNKEAIEFEYSLTLTSEELGQAVMSAFEYCTSIYKK